MPKDWMMSVFADAIPAAPKRSVVEWAEANVILPGSAKSDKFQSIITPWTREPLECAGDGVTQSMTFAKPVQSGGSVVGECALCYWISTATSGDIQYNWQNDVKALERWDKRIERILKATPAVMQRWPADRNKAKKGLVMFPHANLTVQGVFTDSNVASDSIRFQINEELHDENGGWTPGRLEQAYKRTTAFWNRLIFNISNAGVVGGQLHAALNAGTLQHWMVKCPGCSNRYHEANSVYHILRTEWDEKRPDLGGLRYDSSKSKRVDGTYDYNKLESTIFYQMPCTYRVHDVSTERRPLSLSGKYSDPTNTGAHLSNRSYTLDGVSVDYIPFLTLIQEKHTALKALKYGDPKPYADYLRERECRFWDPEERPLTGRVVLTSGIKKDREGLKKHPDFFSRFFALDRQQGSLKDGELPHWWIVIRDVAVAPNGIIRTLLVFEGKVETDEDVIGILDRHECVRRHGVADSGDDTEHVYKFCLRYGINAIKGGAQAFYSHGDDGLKIFSVEKPLYQMVNGQPTCDNPLDEPQFWFYSKFGIASRLDWLRSSKDVKYETPSDVSDDYKAHHEAQELRQRKNPRTGQVENEYVKIKKRDDLLICERYIAMLMEMAGVIAVAIGEQLEEIKS